MWRRVIRINNLLWIHSLPRAVKLLVRKWSKVSLIFLSFISLISRQEGQTPVEGQKVSFILLLIYSFLLFSMSTESKEIETKESKEGTEEKKKL